jgi:DNA primase catalytic core
MRFPPSFLDEIRTRLPISAIVGRRVAWDKRKSQPGKGDFWACCPFHGEKTPSFHADDRRGRYHCFGCGASGDHFTFLVEREGLSFPEAVEQLAAEAGLALPERDPDADRREAARASLYDVMEAAARFFEAALAGPDGGTARAYLRDRGLSADIQKRFRIGYAPASRSALKEHLAGNDIGQEQMVEAGLLIAGEDIAVSFDRFRDRIIFPITDLRGRAIAFGGRALSPDAQAKYLNSPDTPLFQKGRVLFNGQAARAAARKGGHVVVVEGYTDAIACVAAGFEATVAPLGTALTEEQLQLLWQMADEPILCFDGDEAGLRAAYRAIDTALPHLKPGKSLKFALLPQGQDPDDLIRVAGAEAFRAVLESAQPLVEMLWTRESEGTALDTPERQAGLEARLYLLISRIGDVNVLRRYRAHMRLRLAQSFNPYKREQPRSVELEPALGSRKGPLERLILGFCVEYPFLLVDFIEHICELEYENDVHREFSKGLHLLVVEFDHVDVHLIYDKLGPRFYFFLNLIHGDEKRREIKDERGRVVRVLIERRGHKLRALFPMLRYNPPDDLVHTTMSFLLMRWQLMKLEQFDPRELMPPDRNAADFERRVASEILNLNDLRRRVRDQEVELEYAYQQLKASFADAA